MFPPLPFDYKDLSPLGKTKLTLKTTMPFLAHSTMKTDCKSPPDVPRFPSFNLTQFVFGLCLSHANRIQWR